MTIRKAERQLECDIQVTTVGFMFYAEATTPDGFHVKSDGFKLRHVAISDLVNKACKLICAAVFESQGYKCAMCARILPLQGHHVKFRSHGGTHRISNIEGLCAEDHEKVHRGE